MSIPTNLTNKQLRLLVRIEKLLFEKKDCSFEEVLVQAKRKPYHVIEGRDMGTSKATTRFLGINKDIVNRVILGAGVCIH